MCRTMQTLHWAGQPLHLRVGDRPGGRLRHFAGAVAAEVVVCHRCPAGRLLVGLDDDAIARHHPATALRPHAPACTQAQTLP